MDRCAFEAVGATEERHGNEGFASWHELGDSIDLRDQD